MNELGYDEAIIRGAGPLTEQLAKAAPEGIDVFFDNVGGEQLQAAVEAARPGARFVPIGALAGQLSEHGTGTTAPVQLDSMPLIRKTDRDAWLQLGRLRRRVGVDRAVRCVNLERDTATRGLPVLATSMRSSSSADEGCRSGLPPA